MSQFLRIKTTDLLQTVKSSHRKTIIDNDKPYQTSQKKTKVIVKIFNFVRAASTHAHVFIFKY